MDAKPRKRVYPGHSLNSGERIDYICSLCQVNINAWSLLMAGPVLKPVELIPLNRDSFPRLLCGGEFQFLPAGKIVIPHPAFLPQYACDR